MPKQIAIVEDEPTIAENYRDALQQAGYGVSLYADRPTAWAAFEKQLPDLAIIDVGLGDEFEGGFDLCRDLRNRSATLPIVFLTARESEFDKVSGLRLGADDYLTKDISLHHMMARITALFRRIAAISAGNREAEEVLKRGPLSINKSRLQLLWQESLIDLTVTEFWIVHALARYPGQVKNRQQLMDAASVVLDDNTITSHIKRIRKKFQAIDSQFNCIVTVYAQGYRWLDTQNS